MRIRITHETVYHYSEPAKSAIQLLRLTPRGHDGQTVLSWNIDMDGDARLMRREDWYGNIIHSLSVSGPVSQITLQVRARSRPRTRPGSSGAGSSASRTSSICGKRP